MLYYATLLLLTSSRLLRRTSDISLTAINWSLGTFIIVSSFTLSTCVNFILLLLITLPGAVFTLFANRFRGGPSTCVSMACVLRALAISVLGHFPLSPSFTTAIHFSRTHFLPSWQRYTMTTRPPCSLRSMEPCLIVLSVAYVGTHPASMMVSPSSASRLPVSSA